MRAKTIIKHILESDLTSEEIREIWSVLKTKSGILRQLAVRSHSVGDYVKFKGRKRGRTVYGRVTKRNRKTLILLASDGVEWKVTPNILEPSTKEEYDSGPLIPAFRSSV